MKAERPDFSVPSFYEEFDQLKPLLGHSQNVSSEAFVSTHRPSLPVSATTIQTAARSKLVPAVPTILGALLILVLFAVLLLVLARLLMGNNFYL